MKHRFPGEPRRMAFIHRSERRAREAWMRAMSPPLFVVPEVLGMDLAVLRPGMIYRTKPITRAQAEERWPAP